MKERCTEKQEKIVISVRGQNVGWDIGEILCNGNGETGIGKVVCDLKKNEGSL